MSTLSARDLDRVLATSRVPTRAVPATSRSSECNFLFISND